MFRIFEIKNPCLYETLNFQIEVFLKKEVGKFWGITARVTIWFEIDVITAVIRRNARVTIWFEIAIITAVIRRNARVTIWFEIVIEIGIGFEIGIEMGFESWGL